jgi:hypothetical protein
MFKNNSTKPFVVVRGLERRRLPKAARRETRGDDEDKRFCDLFGPVPEGETRAFRRRASSSWSSGVVVPGGLESGENRE